jgi:ABC-type multidrug transport system fused ATPase/permease subunit
MLTKDIDALRGQAAILKSWTVAIVTLMFVSIYAAALLGWFGPAADHWAAMRLAPIVFLVIGYCFGRLPAQQTETTLMKEVRRQTQRIQAAQAAKERADQCNESLEEKITSVRSVLTSKPTAIRTGPGADRLAPDIAAKEALRYAVAAAVQIVNSHTRQNPAQ